MSIEEKKIKYAKEADDVMVLVVHLIREARAKKPISEIASGSVAKLVNALSGVDQVGAELAENRKVVLQTVGYRSGELTDAILGQPESNVPAV